VSKSKTIKPPQLAERIFSWYCSRAAVEDLQGDLEELFYHNVERMSVRRAKLLYWGQVISLIFSYAIKKRKQQAAYHTFSTSSFNPAMLKNYFLIAARNLAKHKMFTVINVFGLSIGMSISLLFISLMAYVFTYDNFHENKDRIYRVISYTDDKQRTDALASSPEAIGRKLREEFSGIEKVVRFSSELRVEAMHNTKAIPLSGFFTDPEFLEVFNFDLIKGSAATALTGMNNVLITEEAATKFFGNDEPVGKVLQLGMFGEFEITGVLKNPPRNSHLQFELIAPYQAYEKAFPFDKSEFDPWVEFRNNYVYLLMPEQHDIAPLQGYLNSVANEAYATNENFKARFELQPFNDIAPGPDLSNAIGPEWGTAGFIVFGVLTLLILLPACFNYATISISRALKRMKEIGIRKVMGGQRGQIFFQFIMETVIITMISFGLSYYIFTLIREEFQSMIVEPLDLTPSATTIAYFVLFILFIGFAAGFVPAMYFSKLNPIQALKVKPSGRGFSKLTLRKILIVSQFALSLGFIMMVVIAMRQYRYAISYDFGFQQENILDVELQGVDPQVFRNEFGKLASVQAISMSSHVLGTSSTGRDWIRNAELTDSVEAFQMSVDENYLLNFHLSLVAGKNFGESDALNRKSVIINEALLQDLHIRDKRDAVGKPIIVGDTTEAVIIGVVKNFHYMDLREPIRAFFFTYNPHDFRYANLTVSSKDMFTDLSEMEAVWKTLGNENKFAAQFFDDELKDSYDFYFSMIKVCGFLGLLAITISCLGLLGMVVFTVENRIKEIGIRKVMGSSTSEITILLSRDYLRLLVIAAIIAIPATWWLAQLYYENAQYYRAEIGLIDIGLSLAIIVVLGCGTVLSQTSRAAKANPVDTLRYE
jgi:putative ABC transport system permease protein